MHLRFARIGNIKKSVETGIKNIKGIENIKVCWILKGKYIGKTS